MHRLMLLVMLKLITVESATERPQNPEGTDALSTTYRPIPATQADLLKPERSSQVEARWCTMENCNTPFKADISEDSSVCMVIDDIVGLTDSTKIAERIGIGCARMNYIAILILWDRLQPTYYQAVANSHGVAFQVYVHVLKLHKTVHIIGLGVGAHIAGYIGKLSKDNGRIHRITGLDPNRILFEYNEGPAYLRLDKSDAMFVDVYHTDYKGKMRMGFIQNIGTVDFYDVGTSGCQRAPAVPGDAMEVWTEQFAILTKKVSKCMHNYAAINFVAMMAKNCSLYGVRNIRDPCVKDNCVGMGFLSHAFVIHTTVGGGTGNYVYNATQCVWGVPYTTWKDEAFREVYDAWDAGEHRLLDDVGWIEWIFDSVMEGIDWGIAKVFGLFYGMVDTVGWAGLPTFGLKELLHPPQTYKFRDLPSIRWLLPSLPDIPGMPSLSSLIGMPSLNPLDYIPKISLNPFSYLPSLNPMNYVPDILNPMSYVPDILNPFNYTYLLNPMTYVPSALNPLNYIPEIPYVPIIGR